MESLPDRPNPEQLRTQDKELKRALSEGDGEAMRRVLESHPKFAGRPAERMEGRVFTLRDAQVTIAREHGFESWKEMLSEIEGEKVVRWGEESWSGPMGRAMLLANKLGHKTVMGEHLLLLLLAPDDPTPSSEVLAELGVTEHDVRDRLGRMRLDIEGESKDTRSSPVYYMLSSLAQGIAIGMGAKKVTDEHALLAIAYGDPTGNHRLIGSEIDPDDLIDGLRRRGVPVPPLAPPVLTTPMGPWGPTVYYLPHDMVAVHEILSDRYPPGTAVWGTNNSSWKDGYIYIHGEDEIPMEEIVRGAVKDPSTVEILSFKEAAERESGRAPRKPEDQPKGDRPELPG